MILPIFKDKAYWKAASMEEVFNNGLLFQQIFEASQKLGFIGDIEWYERDKDRSAKPLKGKDPMELIKAADFGKNGNDIPFITFGGNQPTSWDIFISMSPFSEGCTKTQAYNRIQLTFGKQHLLEQSETVIPIFYNIHKNHNTEYAQLYTNDEMLLLTKKVYKRPITPVLDGLYWLNYLGTKHMERFNKEKLTDLNVYKMDWVHGNSALFIQTTKSIHDFMDNERLASTKQATKELKKAKKRT